MSKESHEGQQQEWQGKLKEWWGMLTDEELKQASGNAEQIVGLLQKRYGYTREYAEAEFNRRLKDMKESADKKL